MNKINHKWIAEQAIKYAPDGLKQILENNIHKAEEGAWAPDLILKDMEPNHINKLDKNGKRTGKGQNPEKVLFLCETIIDAHKLGFTPEDEMALWYFLLSHYIADGNMPHHNIADKVQHETHQHIEDIWGEMAQKGLINLNPSKVQFEGNVEKFMISSNIRAWNNFNSLITNFKLGKESKEFLDITTEIQNRAVSDIISVWSHIWERAK